MNANTTDEQAEKEISDAMETDYNGELNDEDIIKLLSNTCEECGGKMEEYKNGDISGQICNNCSATNRTQTKSCKECENIGRNSDGERLCQALDTVVIDIIGMAKNCRLYKIDEGIKKAFTQIEDPINPEHYKAHGIEAKEITLYLDNPRGNAIKYIWRCYEKGKFEQDLKKAIWYLKGIDIIGRDNLAKVSIEDEEVLHFRFINGSKGFKAWQSLAIIYILENEYELAINVIKEGLNAE